MAQLPMQVVLLSAANHKKFFLCLIVASLPSSSVGCPDPGMPVFLREDNTEQA